MWNENMLWFILNVNVVLCFKKDSICAHSWESNSRIKEKTEITDPGKIMFIIGSKFWFWLNKHIVFISYYDLDEIQIVFYHKLMWKTS